MFKYLLEKNEIKTNSREGVTLSSSIPTAQIVPQLLAGKIQYALVPEPFATIARMKSKEVVVAIDIQDEYEYFNGKGSTYPLTVMVVRKGFDKWKSSGIDTPLKARNYILDSHVSNIEVMASEIAERNHNDDLKDKILFGSEMKDLQGTRDYLIELYETGRYDMLLSFAHTTYHKDILDYLPDEVREYIQKHSA